MTPTLEVLIAAAIAGGDEAKRLLPQAEIAVEKDLGDFATTADIRGQQTILAVLAKECPGVPIIAEEDEHDEALPTSFFTVDPLDGTIIASRGSREWGTLLSYIHEGSPRLAVLYQPALNRMIAAERGKGCFYYDPPGEDGERLEILPGTPERILLSFELSYAFSTSQVERTLLRVVRNGRIAITRSAGAAIHAGFELALGRIDAYVNIVGAKIWDFAPVVLAVEEAGGEALFLDSRTLQSSGFRWDSIHMGAVMGRAGGLVQQLAETFAGKS